MPKGVKRSQQELVIRGRKGSTWQQDNPIHFDLTHGYLWVGKHLVGVGWDYLFSISPADARKLRDFLNDTLGAEKVTGRDGCS